ncbi:hypothetical protein [Pseudomonas aeruginosa]|uniref:hypothetical protein n=1 Tax=Pseudomonas aeruginosa TaxID=287 RepID=UPI0032B41DB4
MLQVKPNRPTSKHNDFVFVLIIIFTAAVAAWLYMANRYFTITHGMGRTAYHDLTYGIPAALIRLEAVKGPCSTISINAEELAKRGAPKKSANGSQWFATNSADAVTVVYPYNDGDDSSMSMLELRRDLISSPNIKSAELSADGIQVTYACLKFD